VTVLRLRGSGTAIGKTATTAGHYSFGLPQAGPPWGMAAPRRLGRKPGICPRGSGEKGREKRLLPKQNGACRSARGKGHCRLPAGIFDCQRVRTVAEAPVAARQVGPPPGPVIFPTVYENEGIARAKKSGELAGRIFDADTLFESWTAPHRPCTVA